jgi:hypothetical protein
MTKMPKITITFEGVPLEDLQRTRDIHLASRTRHYPKKHIKKGAETRGRKGTMKPKIYRKQIVDVGDPQKVIEIAPAVVNDKIIHIIKLISRK